MEDGAIVLSDLTAYTPVRLAVPLVGEIKQPHIDVSFICPLAVCDGVVAHALEPTGLSHGRVHHQETTSAPSQSPTKRLLLNRTATGRQRARLLPRGLVRSRGVPQTWATLTSCTLLLSLLSKFSVATDGTRGLIVRSAEIQAPDVVPVQACRSDASKVVVGLRAPCNVGVRWADKEGCCRRRFLLFRPPTFCSSCAVSTPPKSKVCSPFLAPRNALTRLVDLSLCA